MVTEINYEEHFMLGEKTKNAFFKGESHDKIERDYPNFVNTREIGYGLNVTDEIIAGVLAGVPTLLIGDKGCGKSQAMFDISDYYFNGAKRDGGESVIINIDPKTEIMDGAQGIYRRFNLKEGKIEYTSNVGAYLHALEEVTRTSQISQNQFYPLLNGYVSDKGGKAFIGRDGYSAVLGTANYENGKFKGTFGMDEAFLNRWGIVIDFDYKVFKPTEEDRMLINLLKDPDGKVKPAPKRDISDLIIKANKEIKNISSNPGLGALAVANYIEFGLENCLKNVVDGDSGMKDKSWPMDCQDCGHNKKDDAICSLIKAPVTRTKQFMIKYAAALHYLAKLKNPNVEIDPVELMFKSFEMTGAYQSLLNAQVLQRNYGGQSPLMMRDVVSKLKEDFRENEDYIMTSLKEAREGKLVEDFYKEGETIGIYDVDIEKIEEHNKNLRKLRERNDKLPEGKKIKRFPKDKSIPTKIQPFTDNRKIRLGWVKTMCGLEKKVFEMKGGEEE